MVFLLGLPLVQCTFYNLAIGRDPQGLRVAVVNEELMKGLSECSNYPSTGCNLDLPLTCRYIDKLKGRTLKIVRTICLLDTTHLYHLYDLWLYGT